MADVRRDSGPEVHVYGIPGAGKTTQMAKWVSATAQARGPKAVMVVSFTKTAAREIGERDEVRGEGAGPPIPEEQIGTVHAMAYRAIGRPTVAVSRVKDWNKQHSAWSMGAGGTGQGRLDDPDFVGTNDGDSLLSEVDRLRALLIPEERWPVGVRRFNTAWTEWKQANELVDFADMLERALQECPVAPGRPEVIFADESQDLSPLELALIRQWGSAAERLIIAGDPDQAIYSFRGASGDAFFTDIPEDDKVFLDRSWRCPERVLDVAERWVAQLTRKEEGRRYIPRDDEGIVTRAPFDASCGDDLVLAIEKHLERDQTVMILTACSYQLEPVKAALRRAGLPYGNRWRPARGDWNPLGFTTARQTRASDRLLAYLVMDEEVFGERARLWTGDDVRLWTKFLKSTGVLRRGVRETINSLPTGEVTYEQIEALFVSEEALEAAVEPSLAWFKDHLTAEGKRALEFPLQVAGRHGPLALEDEPLVTIGTVHSAKGAEADVVYLCPDLSMAGAREWDAGGAKRDSVIRQFYVGMTRAREELHLLVPKGLHAPIGDFVKA